MPASEWSSGHTPVPPLLGLVPELQTLFALKMQLSNQSTFLALHANEVSKLWIIIIKTIHISNTVLKFSAID